VLDKQRRKLLEICSKAFEDLAKPGISAESFNDLLDTFAEMQREYFDAEEKLLAHHGYPDLQSHMAEHETFKLRLDDLLNYAANGWIYRRALLMLMADFAGSHLLQTDIACEDFLSERRWQSLSDPGCQ
jgi:hemerythrin-like metal-binding protein